MVEREGSALPSPIAWRVRAGKDDVSTAPHSLEHGVVTVGWGEWIAGSDPSTFTSRESLERYLEQQGIQDPRLSKGCGEIWLFCSEIAVGDLVVMPLKRMFSPDRRIAIGRITGPAETDASQPQYARLRRSVSWMTTDTPEDALQPDLLGSVKFAQHTVLKLDKPNAASRLIDLAQYGEDPGPENPEPEDPFVSAGEAGGLDRDGTVLEGATKQVSVNKYERDNTARRICIAAHGTDCAVCGVDFGAVYGDFADGYI